LKQYPAKDRGSDGLKVGGHMIKYFLAIKMEKNPSILPSPPLPPPKKKRNKMYIIIMQQKDSDRRRK
jgi:hypothetical protein